MVGDKFVHQYLLLKTKIKQISWIKRRSGLVFEIIDYVNNVCLFIIYFNYLILTACNLIIYLQFVKVNIIRIIYIMLLFKKITHADIIITYIRSRTISRKHLRAFSKPFKAKYTISSSTYQIYHVIISFK